MELVALRLRRGACASIALAVVCICAPSVRADCVPADACQRAAIVAQRLDADARQLGAMPEQATLYEMLRLQSSFRFLPGDVLLLRSDALVSAAISQIATQPAFFSHMAIVGLDPQWDALEVIEAGVEEGLRGVELDDWLDRGAVRFAVYRHRDRALAQRAAVAAYRDAAARRGNAREYDFAFDLDDETRLYCSELVMRAYAAAAPQTGRVPAQLSDVGTLIETFPLDALGVRSAAVFMPDDLETDERFERVLELRTPTLLARSAAMDRALRATFDALRGSQRAATLAALDSASTQSPLSALPLLLRESHATWRRLPEPLRSRLAALARIVADETEATLAAAAS